MVEILKVNKTIFMRKTCDESYNIPRYSNIYYYSDNGIHNCYNCRDLYIPRQTAGVVTVNYNYGGDIEDIIEKLSSGGMEVRYKELEGEVVVFVKELGRGYEVHESLLRTVTNNVLIETLKKDATFINF